MKKEGFYFEDYTEEWSYTTRKKTITEEMLEAFVALCDFTSPTFADPAYSSQQYEGRLVPGIFALSLAEGLVLSEGVTYKRGIFLIELTPTFLKPVYTGDTIHNRVRLKSKRLTRKIDRGVVVCTHEVVNNRDEVVIRYDSTRMTRTHAYTEATPATT